MVSDLDSVSYGQMSPIVSHATAPEPGLGISALFSVVYRTKIPSPLIVAKPLVLETEKINSS